jgi:trehalose utilization protein
VLDETDVLFWWGHMLHDKVEDTVVKRVQENVLSGMGLIVLHSGHFSKIFKVLMGTHCSLRWREAGEKEILWNVAPGHPITRGISDTVEIPRTEMYGERFDIPEPTQLVFISWYEGGNVFRSGCTFIRGNGRIFYFAPGHETYPIYHDTNIQKILANAARWAKNESKRDFKQAPQEKVAMMKIGK